MGNARSTIPDEDVVRLVIHASIQAGLMVKNLRWKPKGLFGKKELLLIETEEGVFRFDPATIGEMTVEALAAKLQGE